MLSTNDNINICGTLNCLKMDELRELGLDENESKVYLACLQLGNAKVHEISKTAQIQRTTTYGILKSLAEKGMVSSLQKEGINYYHAARPKELMRMMDEKREKIQQILPQLERLQKTTPHIPSVEFFQGIKGLKTVVYNVLQSGEDIKYIGVLKEWIEFSSILTAIYYRLKKENKVKVKALIPNTTAQRKAILEEYVGNTDFKFVDNFDVQGACFIYDGKVAFVSVEGIVRGHIIKDESFYKLQNGMFENLWNTN